jgi:hypothetical protein
MRLRRSRRAGGRTREGRTGVISSSLRISMTVGIRGESPRTVRFWIWNPEELHLWGIPSVSRSRPLSFSLSTSAPGVLGCDLTMRVALTIDIIVSFFFFLCSSYPLEMTNHTEHEHERNTITITVVAPTKRKSLPARVKQRTKYYVPVSRFSSLLILILILVLVPYAHIHLPKQADTLPIFFACTMFACISIFIDIPIPTFFRPGMRRSHRGYRNTNGPPSEEISPRE